MALGMTSFAFANTTGNVESIEAKEVKKEVATTPILKIKEERIQKGVRILCRLTLTVISGNSSQEYMFTSWANTRAECSAFFRGTIAGFNYAANYLD